MYSKLFRSIQYGLARIAPKNTQYKIPRLLTNKIQYGMASDSSRFNIQNIPLNNPNRVEIDKSSKQKHHLTSFADPSNGVIFLNQHYEKLFHDQRSLLKNSIQSISLDFYNEGKVDKLMNIKIQSNKITLTTFFNNGIPQIVQTPFEHKLFPSKTQVYETVQKKIWISFNRLKRALDIYTGDVADPKYAIHLFSHNFQTEEQKKNIQQIQQKFLKPNPEKLPGKIFKLVNKFDYLYHFKITVKQHSNTDLKKTIQNLKEKLSIPEEYPPVSIDDVFTAHLLNIDRFYAPILSPNPSFLQPHIPGIFSLPEQLRILYNVLNSFDLKSLPDSNNKKGYEDIKQGRWKNLPNAIQYSVTTPHMLFTDNNKKTIPLGILNHLYELKNGKAFSFLKLEKKTPQEIINEVIQQKSGYIRMEILPHQGLSPGSVAVLQIWPPFSSSPIHNHGHAFGLIKILSGQVRVQNFRELTFADIGKVQPYLESDYKEGQYTWLSEQSYSIHRLLNPYTECCLSLQSYYHYKNTTKTAEYFSFIEKQKDNQQFYSEYYPQNDWQNYLNLKTAETVQDKAFINRVIEYYGLGPRTAQEKTIDHSFESFTVTMKRQYDTINEQIKGL